MSARAHACACTCARVCHWIALTSISGLWRIRAKRGVCRRPDLKVVLMSATLDADIFSAFFDPPAPHVALKGRTFPVQDLYLEDFLSQSNWRVHTGECAGAGCRGSPSAPHVSACACFGDATCALMLVPSQTRSA